MKTNNEFSIEWYRSPIDPDLLQELNQRDDRKGLVLTLLHLGLIALTFTSALVALEYRAWPLLALAILAHGTVTKFSINAVHEFVHGTVFRTKWLNTFFCYIYSFIGWLQPRAFWASHTEHHKFTMHLPHDMEVIAPAPANFRHLFRTGLFDRHMILGPILGNWGYANGRFATDGWEAYLLQDDSAAKQAITVWARTLLLGHLGIAVVSLYYGNWLIPVLTSFTPAYGKLLQELCNGLQHTGLPGEVSDFRLSCRTVRLNRVFEFLYWNMNYHTEHHMFAAVPFYNLRKLHEAIRDDLPPIHDGLASGWGEVIAIQHRIQDDPDYRFIQKLPNTEEKETSSVPTDDSEATSSSDNAPDKPETAIAEQTAEKDSEPAQTESASRQWECTVCGFVYDESLGLPDEGIPPGTAWDDIPDDWMCPDCGVEKSDFDMIQI